MDNKNNITISKYINGELTGAELTAFERLLQQDKALADEVNFHKLVDETLAENYRATSELDDNEQLEFEGILSKVMNSEEISGSTIHESETQASSNIFRKLIPFAALAAAAALLLFFWLGGDSQNENSNLADDYYSQSQYEYSFSTMGHGDNNLIEAEKAYKAGDYNKAINIFKNYPDDLRAQIAKGNAEYNLMKYDEAVKTFEKIRNSKNVSFRNYANWYLALTYLKKDNKNQAIELLKQLPKNADFYKQAQELIKELE